MENEQAKQIKQRCKTDIICAMATDTYYVKVRTIDIRLADYIMDAAQLSADHANL